MITKLPIDLKLGDRLATYTISQQRSTPLVVLEVDAPVSGTVFITTNEGPFRASVHIPVEVEI